MAKIKSFVSKFENEIIIFIWFLVLAGILVTKILYFGLTIPDWDEAHHLLMASAYFHGFFDPDINLLIQLIVDSGQMYPPFHHIIVSFFFLFFGVSATSGAFANIPFIFILMFSVYKLGSLHNKEVGLWAALLTPVLPAFLVLQEFTYLDYASIAFFIWSYYLLFKTEFFTNRKYSALFGISILLNLLTKWPFMVPALPFIFYAAVSLFTHRSSKIKSEQFRNVLIVVFLSLIALEWYKFNYEYITHTLNFFGRSDNFPQLIWNTPKGFTIANLLFYFKVAIGPWGVGMVVFLYFLVALFFQKKKSMYIYYFLASTAVTYITLTYINDKADKYIAYVYPLVIIVVLTFLYSLKSNFLKSVCLSLFISAVVGNFLMAHITYPKPITVKLLNHIILPGYATRLLDVHWPTEELVGVIKENDEICKKGTLILADNRYLNPNNLRYFLVTKETAISFGMVAAGYDYYNPASSDIPDIKFMDKFSCVITKTGALGDFANPKVAAYIKSYLDSVNNFKLTKFDAPDSSQILLYIKNE